MWDWILKYWLQVGFGALCAAIATCFAMVRGQRKRKTALEKGVKALLCDRLMQAYHFHEEQGYISVPELRNVEFLYNAYHELGGNGTGTEIYKRMKGMPAHPPQGGAGAA